VIVGAPVVAEFTVNIAVWELPKFVPAGPQSYRLTTTVQPFIAKVAFEIVYEIVEATAP
jgi:hypothetical protein